MFLMSLLQKTYGSDDPEQGGPANMYGGWNTQ